MLKDSSPRRVGKRRKVNHKCPRPLLSTTPFLYSLRLPTRTSCLTMSGCRASRAGRITGESGCCCILGTPPSPATVVVGGISCVRPPPHRAACIILCSSESGPAAAAAAPAETAPAPSCCCCCCCLGRDVRAPPPPAKALAAGVAVVDVVAAAGWREERCRWRSMSAADEGDPSIVAYCCMKETDESVLSVSFSPSTGLRLTGARRGLPLQSAVPRTVPVSCARRT